MVEDTILRITLAVIIGTLAAIVYSLRILVLMERRVARIEEHLDKAVHKLLRSEERLERKMGKRR